MKVLTPLKAIRAKCLDCSCGQIKEVRLCPMDDCPLYPYRMGHRPKFSEEDDVDEEDIDLDVSIQKTSATLQVFGKEPASEDEEDT